MEAISKDVVIIGAGSGGLVLAILLAKKGFKVAIFERLSCLASPPRGEIVQPGSLEILDRLGLLTALLKEDIYRFEKVHFYKVGGNVACKDAQLCTVNYGALPPPYNYALVVLPERIQNLLLEEAIKQPNIEIFWESNFQSIVWAYGKPDKIVGAQVEHQGKTIVVNAPVIIGNDGGQSSVRLAFHIKANIHRYPNGYLAMMVDRPAGFDGHMKYYIGKGVVLAVFPVSDKQLFLLLMLSVESFDLHRKRGIKALKEDILSVHPDIRDYLKTSFAHLHSFDVATFMKCFRVKCDRWVVDGGVLMGDSAHAMNPHTASGRNSAMADAVVLAEVLENCFRYKDFSRQALGEYEKLRRPYVDYLQSLGDQMVWVWESGWSPLVWARDRIFRSLDKNPKRLEKILMTMAGVKRTPFTSFDIARSFLDV
jgi:2-polyprenyl-6-methoxyphenol hydroxylase-like FAD-dependent oxidoreductase